MSHLVPVAALAVAGLAACDLPTAPPRFENVFVVRAADLALGAADLVPDSVTVSADSSAFVVETEPFGVSATLGEMCSACVPANGTTVPKPAFTHTFGGSISRPSDLASADVASGTIPVTVSHNLGFDPIRPSATARGSAVITILNGTTVIATHAMNGTTVDLPSGITRTIQIPLSAFTWTQDLRAELMVDSPAGDPVHIDISRSISLAAGPVTASITSVTVNVASRSFADTSELDLTEWSGDFDDMVQGGAIRFQIENPFNVGGSFTIEFDAGGTVITKGFVLEPGATSTNRISLTADEILSLIGQMVEVRMEGGFSAPGGLLTLTPDQVARIVTDMELTMIPFGG